MSDAKPASVQPVIRSRLLPRISFRSLLILTTLAALIAAVGRSAGDGGALATAAIVTLIVPAFTFLLFLVLFLFSWSISAVWFRAEDESTLKGSPFAEGQLPPQILPPREKNE